MFRLLCRNEWSTQADISKALGEQYDPQVWRFSHRPQAWPCPVRRVPYLCGQKRRHRAAPETKKQEFRQPQGVARTKPFSAYLVAPDAVRRVCEADGIGRPEPIFGIYTN